VGVPDYKNRNGVGNLMAIVIIGDNTGDDYSGTEDAWLRSIQTLNNWGAWSEMNVQRYTSGNHAVSCLKFSGINNIPGGSNITGSSVFIYKHNGTQTNNTITAKRLLRNWIEGSLTGSDRTNDTPDSCCWAEYGNGSGWTTPGALSDGNDRSSTVSDTTTVSATNQYYEFSSAQIVQDVSNFRSGSYSNYGWNFERTDGTDDSTYNSFQTSEGTDGQRPYLSVTYTESSSGNTYYYQQQQM
jgi:hypothetical protein